MDGGLVAHTLHDDRDLNSAKPLFESTTDVKTDPEMVQLGVQLIDRQTGQYDPSDVEDRYETRLRAMLEAKLKPNFDSLADAGALNPQKTAGFARDLRIVVQRGA